jgi:eukaryotic-like serine/threonine-protein kinase
MRSRISPVEALVTIPRLKDEADRRANWRQAVAALGQTARVVDRPPPLDGVEPTLLLQAVRVALESALVDDLDWIEPGKAAVALYELTSALAPGNERRELGKRVYQRLYEGTAATFSAVATRMALGAARSLDTPPLRARVALLFELPTGTTVNSDMLAFALVARRDTFERWVARPSTGALPARRLAAKLLEYAAREAVARSLQGDAYPRQLLLSPDIQPTFRRLLFDREPLVWRHAAVARGLLATVDRHSREEVELSLDPALSPTEWRRAAVSLVALTAGDPQTALKQCRRLLVSEIGHADPGIAAAMLAGLPRVIDAEPDAADALFEVLVSTHRVDVAEAAAALLSDVTTRALGARSTQTLRQALLAARNPYQPASLGVIERAIRVIDHDDIDSLGESVRQALLAFESSGARAAHDAALHLAEQAHQAAEQLEHTDAADESALSTTLALLTDIDASCLERSCLYNLLLMNRRPGEADLPHVPIVERLNHRLGRWLLDAVAIGRSQGFSASVTSMQQRCLRALLHLMDAETVQGDSEETGQRIRLRLRQAAQTLLAQIAAGPDAAVHRILCATLARSFDTAVRESVAEPSDLFLVVAHHLTDRESILAIAEASTNADVRTPLLAYSAFLGAAVGDAADPTLDTPSSPGEDSLAADESLVARRVVRLSQAVGAGGSYRGEAMRHTILRLGRALEIAAAARGMSELVDRNRSGIDAMRELEQAAKALSVLIAGAKRRVLDAEFTLKDAATTDVVPLSVLVERAMADGVPPNANQVQQAIAELVHAMPETIAASIATVCSRLESLPIAAASDVYAIPLEKRRAPLPEWLLPRRMIGAFYVVKALGSGGVSSVFVARRLEERNNPRAPLFALKVPEFDPTTARSLSEAEFLAMFRDEAGALISLPHHPNLARFVTFDLAARPKPILVMELISGFGLDRLIRSRALTVERAFSYLDGILCGLEAMHSAGFGHLDLKPSNVILRDNSVPVLVDFGLSGRKIRPGCGTLDYCAPEILGVAPDPSSVTPMAADVYAFGSMAFEVLTGIPLFDGADEMALVTQHVSHDGWPERLAKLGRRARTSEMAVVLAACLRHDGRARPSVSAVRQALCAVAGGLKGEPWPMSLEEVAERPKSA